MTRIPGFRWRIVPAFLCAFFGAVIALGGLGQLGMMSLVYYHLGLLPDRPDTLASKLFSPSAATAAFAIDSILVGSVLVWLGTRLWPRWHR